MLCFFGFEFLFINLQSIHQVLPHRRYTIVHPIWIVRYNKKWCLSYTSDGAFACSFADNRPGSAERVFLGAFTYSCSGCASVRFRYQLMKKAKNREHLAAWNSLFAPYIAQRMTRHRSSRHRASPDFRAPTPKCVLSIRFSPATWQYRSSCLCHRHCYRRRPRHGFACDVAHWVAVLKLLIPFDAKKTQHESTLILDVEEQNNCQGPVKHFHVTYCTCRPLCRCIRTSRFDSVAITGLNKKVVLSNFHRCHAVFPYGTALGGRYELCTSWSWQLL